MDGRSPQSSYWRVCDSRGPTWWGGRGSEPGSCALQGQLSQPPLSPPTPQALEVALRLTRAQLASPGCGWWRSSHFCSMYRLGFHGSQRNSRQPGWGGATSGLGARAHRVGGSSFTAGRGRCQKRPLPHPVGVCLTAAFLFACCCTFSPGSPPLGSLSVCLSLFSLSLCVSSSPCHHVSAGLSLYVCLSPSRSVSSSCPRAFALVLSAWSPFPSDIQWPAPSFPSRIFSNLSPSQ